MFFGSVVSSRSALLTQTQADVPFDTLAAGLSVHEVGEKDGEAIIPARFRPCPARCLNSSKGGHRFDCGGGQLHRLGDNVEAVTALVLDLDELEPGQFEAVILDGLRADGLEFIWWHTHSHTPEHPKARVLIPFLEPLEISDARQWSLQAWPQLMAHFAVDGMVKADPSCRDPARLYYGPRMPDGGQHKAGHEKGHPLDWRPIVAITDNPKPAGVVLVDEDPTRPVDLDAIRESLSRNDRPEVKRLLKGEPLSPPPGQRGPEDKPRYVAWRDTTASLSMCTEGWESRKVLWQLLEPSWAAEAMADSDHTPRETVEKLLETALGSAPAEKARRDAANAAQKASARAFHEALHVLRYPTERDVPTPPGIAVGLEDLEEPAPAEPIDWMSRCTQRLQKNGDTVVTKTSQTVCAVLRYHPAWAGCFKRNLLTKYVEVQSEILGARTRRQLEDTDFTRVINWIESCPDLGFTADRIWVREAVALVAQDSSFDPWQDLLLSLPRDVYTRAEAGRLLREGLSASTVNDNGVDITQHVETMLFRFILAMVARGLSPGCKVDTTLTLEGLEGTGKSTIANVFALGYSTDAVVDFTQKDTWVALYKNAIVELPELSAFTKAAVRQQKTFLTKSRDTYRKAYGFNDATYERRCVFLATTNEDEYLESNTGNRRIWPVKCGKIDVQGLRQKMPGIVGCAVALYLEADGCAECAACGTRCATHRWWLTEEEEAFAHEQVELRRPDDTLAGRIKREILRLEPDKRPRTLTIIDMVDLLREKHDEKDRRSYPAAAKRLGMQKVSNRGAVSVYSVPAALLTAPKALTGAAAYQHATTQKAATA